MSTERIGRTLLVATAVALFCSLVVSAAVTYLRPIQVAWAEIERNRVILELAGLLETADAGPDREAAMRFREIETLRIDLASGLPEGSTPVYLRMDGRAPGRVILPIEGQGMWAPIHGFVALEGDCNTVAGIAFHQHGETPGIGDRIEDPAWRASWVGKQAFDQNGRVALAPGDGPGDDPVHGFDAISGATVTVDAITRMVANWLGAEGYGPFLERCRAGETLR